MPDTPAGRLRDSALVCMHEAGVTTESLRTVDYTILAGMEADMGDGDEWPGIRETIVESDILVLATPVWVGRPSSVAQRAIERLDAELSNTVDADSPRLRASRGRSAP